MKHRAHQLITVLTKYTLNVTIYADIPK